MKVEDYAMAYSDWEQTIQGSPNDIAYVATSDEDYAELAALAISLDGEAIQGVPAENRTAELIDTAIETSQGRCIQYLETEEEQTVERCIKCVSYNGLLIQYVLNQTRGISEAAIDQTGKAIDYIANKTPALVAQAMRTNKNALEALLK